MTDYMHLMVKEAGKNMSGKIKITQQKSSANSRWK